MNYPKHIVATASLVCNKNNQVLLVKTKRRGWEMPGGVIEEGEDVASALKRETLEEAGVTITIKKFVAFYSNIKDSIVILDFISECEGGLPKNVKDIIDDNEITDVAWFSKEDAMVNVTDKIMSYRLKWLLENKNNVRYAYYSKDPFKVISETVF